MPDDASFQVAQDARDKIQRTADKELRCTFVNPWGDRCTQTMGLAPHKHRFYDPGQPTPMSRMIAQYRCRAYEAGRRCILPAGHHEHRFADERPPDTAWIRREVERLREEVGKTMRTLDLLLSALEAE